MAIDHCAAVGSRRMEGAPEPMEDPELGIWNLDLGWYMELWGLRSAAPQKDKILECPAAPRSISPACPACPPGAPDTGALEHQEHDGQELPDALHSCAAGGTGTHRRTVNGCSSIVKPDFPELLPFPHDFPPERPDSPQAAACEKRPGPPDMARISGRVMARRLGFPELPEGARSLRR